MEYFRLQEAGFPIIIADGAEPDVQEKHLEIVKQYREFGLQVQHLAMEKLSFADRLLEALRTVETDYASVVSDDDFTSVEFLDNAAAYLDDNPGCSAVAGYSLGIVLDGVEPYGRVKEIAYAPPPPSRYEAKAAERILHHEASGNPLTQFESLRPTGDWVKIAGCFSATRSLDPGPDDPHYHSLAAVLLYELTVAHFSLARGKLHSIPHLANGRQIHDTNMGAAIQRDGDLLDVLTRPGWSDMLHPYLDLVSNALAEADNIEPGVARDIILACTGRRLSYRLSVVVERRLRSHFPQLSADPTPSLARRIGRAVPGLRAAKQSLQQFSGTGTAQPVVPRTPEIQLIRQLLASKE